MRKMFKLFNFYLYKLAVRHDIAREKLANLKYNAIEVYLGFSIPQLKGKLV